MGRWVSSPSYRAVVREITVARKEAGLTQRNLAARLGRPYSVVANIERGERRLDLVEFIAIARALGMNEQDLLARILAGIGPQIEL
jgi:transcriptional regulator with XRE-family HTH domain